MEAQHRALPVHGYTTQSQGKIDVVNHNKQIEETILRLLDKMKTNPDIDQRWLAIGRTSIEQGFMAINRAVFQPQRVKLEADEAEPNLPISDNAAKHEDIVA